MITHRVLALGAMVLLTAPLARAQNCSGASEAIDACKKTADLVSFLSPQLAGALAGGNHTLGQGGATGGFPHFSVDVRATVISGSLPKLDGVGFNVAGATGSTFKAENQMIPGLVADASIGVWEGLSLGVTHVGAVDALISATYLQNFNGGDVSAKLSGGGIKLGYGIRLGLLEESLLTPGVAVSYLTRELPTISITGNVVAAGSKPGGTIAINDYSIKTSGWRLTASKNLLIFNVNAGIGQDKYDATANIATTVVAPAPIGTKSSTGSSIVSMNRTNMFVGLSLNLLVAQLVAEAGQSTGGTLPTLTNNFGSDPAKARPYFSAGVRVGF